MKKFIEFKENIIEKLQKSEGEYKGLTKSINNMRADIKISVPSLGEEGNKNIEEVKRQRVCMK